MELNLRRWFREPLLHFLVLGAFLFLLFHFLKGSDGSPAAEIIVTKGTMRTLSENFQRVWQRPPTRKELDSLLQEHIKEEVYYREGVALGLDRDDTIIRRRLRQKMEFLADGIGAVQKPTDQDLQTYLEKHPEKFRIESRYTFTHVYLNPDRHTNSIQKDANEILSILNDTGESVDSSQFGDSFMLGYYFSNQPESNVTRIFGDQFTKQIVHLEADKWVGPVESGYGVHLVMISDRIEDKLPALSEVRAEVKREWMVEQQKQISEKFYKGLRDRYNVKIEQDNNGDTESASLR